VDSQQAAELLPDHVDIQPLTRTGDVDAAAISADGSLIAYVTESAGKQAVMLRQTTAAGATEVVPPLPVHYLGLTFSPDRNFLFCVRSEQRRPAIYNIYRIPVFGGIAVQIVSAVESPVAVSPDGKRLAFIRARAQATGESLMLAQADGSGERVLSKAFEKYTLALSRPAWSPNGKFIALSAFAARYGIAIVSVDDGTVKHLASDRYAFVSQAAWLTNSRIAVTADDASLRGYQLWEITFPAGAVRRLTHDASDYSGLSASADGSRLLTIQRSAPAAIWIASAPAFADAQLLAQDPLDHDWVLGLAWISDRRILFSSKAAGSLDIWAVDLAARRTLPFLSDGFAHPVIVAARDDMGVITTFGGQTHLIETLNLANMSRHTVTSAPDAGCPDLSSDADWVVYITRDSLMKIPAAGGTPTELARSAECFPRISPDGKLVAYNYYDKMSSRNRTAVISIAGGQPLVTLDLPHDSDWQLKRDLRWTPDGKAITYSDTKNGASNLWRMPIAGGTPQQLTHFDSELIFSFAWSRDGSQLAVVRGRRAKDLVEIRLNR
jgi:Tol biopolymer transport system component